jgi:hypothetical protein
VVRIAACGPRWSCRSGGRLVEPMSKSALQAGVDTPRAAVAEETGATAGRSLDEDAALRHHQAEQLERLGLQSRSVGARDPLDDGAADVTLKLV